MFTIDHDRVAVHEVHTCVLGSGAAGLNAALQLKRHGIDDLLLLTEGLDKGTSINTGSDKQTYYKLGLYGGEPDSPHKMAATFFDGGSMHGDTALIEAALSARAFYNLLELGVPFPQDRFGQFPGYKTDHDPLQRATSIGPYTSRAMCRALIAAIKRIGVPVRENRIAVKLPTLAGESDSAAPRVAGVLCVDTHAPPDACLELYLCENLVFAVGGPGGLYRESVYPVPHTGGIGLALEIGAEARNLADSQYGLASTRFRWNVSGTYMQVLPRLVSTAADGASDRREFLLRYFGTPEKTACAVFLKGYQWPFDVRKIDGSSLIDLAVFIETVEKHRRVFLDYRTNMTGLDVTVLPGEVRDYLEKSGALSGTPIERLAKMNMPAVELYREHGIDLAREPLEIALCAQHNNGGLAVGPWWESTNIRHLFPAGEVAGTHGITRPGGSALNAGQVAGFRIAEYIAAKNRGWTLDRSAAIDQAKADIRRLCDREPEGNDWRSWRKEIQARMSDFAGPIVDAKSLEAASLQAWQLSDMFYVHNSTEKKHRSPGCDAIRNPVEWAESLRTRFMAFAAAVYIDAILHFAVRGKTGSRGSRLLLDPAGMPLHPALGERFRYVPENTEKRSFIQSTTPAHGAIRHEEMPRRPIPPADAWFESAWHAYRNGKIFDDAP